LRRALIRYGWMVAFALLLTVSLPGFGFCEVLKIGYVFSERIFLESKDYADAQAEFNKYKTDWEQKAQEMEREFTALQEEYMQQRLLLSEQKKKEKEEQITAKREAFENFVSEVLSPEGKLAEKNRELSKPIYDKIKSTVAKIAEGGQYDLILDASAVLWAAAGKGYDLTDQVIEELNKETQ